ncbi:MAG: hypothetical protein CL610_23040 [Anaerolineaceae bacterium]|nr:hypothetical protein [Anaerolineaceae bacterium]
MASQTRFSVFKQVQTHNPRNIFSAERPRLIHWSHYVEQIFLAQQLRTDIYVGLQYLSNFAPILPLYSRIAQTARRVYVFAIVDLQMDTQPFQVIPLTPQDQLVKEWFVVFADPQESRVLSAIETTPPGASTRTFDGVLTSDAGIAAHVVRQINRQFDLSPAEHKSAGPPPDNAAG